MLSDKIHSVEDNFKVTVSGYKFTDAVQNEEQVTATGMVSGTMSANASYKSFSIPFDFAWYGEQTEAGKDFIIKDDTANKSIQLTVKVNKVVVTEWVDENGVAIKSSVEGTEAQEPGVIVGYTFKETVKTDTGVKHVFTKDIVIPPVKPTEKDNGGLLFDFAKPKVNTYDHKAFMFGYPDRTFLPDNQMTRAEATAMFARLMMDQKLPQGFKADYSDVSADEWYYDAVQLLSAYKIVEGYETGEFRPNASVTRAEFAAMVSRFDKLAESNKTFTDVTQEHWANKFIGSATTKGWVEGYPDGTFKPEQNITRAEVVTVTNRMLNRVADKEFVDKNVATITNYTDLNNSHWAYYNIMEATNGHDYTRKANGTDETWLNLNGAEFRFAVVGYDK